MISSLNCCPRYYHLCLLAWHHTSALLYSVSLMWVSITCAVHQVMGPAPSTPLA